MRQVASYLAVSIREYDDGTNSALLLVQDAKTRRLRCEELPGVEQPAREPFTAYELLLMATLEAYQREIDGQLTLF
jgi:hypothetical protein